MRIISTYRGAQRNWETSEREVTFGRAAGKSASVLDLSPDQKVSRLHGRIWQENGFFWIEDLNSGRGTLVNNAEIKGQGKKKLQAGDVIVAGNTTLQIESSDPHVTAHTNFLETGTTLPPEKRRAQAEVAIIHELDATNFIPLGIEEAKGLGLAQVRTAIVDAAQDNLKSSEPSGTHAPLASSAPSVASRAPEIVERRLNLICELPMHLAAKTELAALLP